MHLKIILLSRGVLVIRSANYVSKSIRGGKCLRVFEIVKRLAAGEYRSGEPPVPRQFQ